MMGLGKGNSLKKWQFLVSMLDFWGVNLLENQKREKITLSITLLGPQPMIEG